LKKKDYKNGNWLGVRGLQQERDSESENQKQAYVSSYDFE